MLCSHHWSPSRKAAANEQTTRDRSLSPGAGSGCIGPSQGLLVISRSIAFHPTEIPEQAQKR